MPAKKQTSRKSTSKKAPDKKPLMSRYVASVLLFAVSILLFCLACVKGEAAWTTLHSFWLGVVGFAAFVWPIALMYFAILLATDKDRSANTRSMICTSVLIFTVQTLVDVFMHTGEEIGFWQYLGNMYTNGAAGGGLLGALLGNSLCEVLGTTGAKIVIILLTFVLVMLLTGTTLITLFKAVSKPAKKIKEVAESAYDKHAAEMEKEKAKVELVPTNRHPYDVAIEGEDAVNPTDVKPVDIKKQGRKLRDAFNGDEISEIVPDVDDSTEEAAESEQSIDDIIDGLNSPITVVSEDKPSGKEAAIDIEVEQPVTAEPEKIEYTFPPISLLNKAPADNAADIRSELSSNAEKLVDTLRSFGVETRVVNISRGPSVTRYELQPAAGVRISRIANLTDDIALSLASSGVRIEAPIPNKSAVGIEVSNKVRSSVSIRELIESDGFINAKSRLTGVLGKDITGENCFMDITKMPHILIAGTTGSGKSVCLNSLIISTLYKATPDEVRFLMIDPKAVEMKVYNGIPHLLVPVVTDPKKAAGALSWAVNEMLRRYQLLSDYNVRNIDGYNELAEHDDSIEKLPKIVIFIDEFADLMMAAPSEVEDSVCRIAQMARAAGMHLVIATQSPRADVITGLIKSNIPSRISLKVASPLESRIILDMQGAERLIGYGDMLYSPTGTDKPVRLQGCWISDAEIKAVTDFLKNGGSNGYDNSIMEEIERQATMSKQNKKAADDDDEPSEYDAMLGKALECVVEMGQASTSMLQRKLKLGYSRAARIMDQLEENRFIGPADGAKARQVLVTPAQLLEMKANGDLDF